MDAELKAKWVSALRSGEYEQTTRSLLNKGSYCCLGVLCDVMGAEWLPGEGDRHALLNGEKQDYYLGQIALETAGMTDKEQECLYQMNDEGSSFADIADHIEVAL